MEPPKKLIESEHYRWLLEKISASNSMSQIRDALEFEKGLKVSKPTLKLFMDWVESQPGGCKELIKSTAVDVRKEEKCLNRYIPKDKITIIGRRVKLIKELNKRISILKECQSKRSDASRKIFGMMTDLETDITNLPIEQNVKNSLLQKAKSLKYSFNYKADILAIRSDLEAVLLRYYTELHENYKYVETFTAKFELAELVEKILAECAELSLSEFMQFVPDSQKEAIVYGFKNKMVAKMKEIHTNDLLLDGE